MTIPPAIKRFQAPIILAIIGVAVSIPAMVTPFYYHIDRLFSILAGLWPFFIGTAIYMSVRRVTRNPVVAVLTVLVLIVAYIGILYLGLVLGLRGSGAGP